MSAESRFSPDVRKKLRIPTAVGALLITLMIACNNGGVSGKESAPVVRPNAQEVLCRTSVQAEPGDTLLGSMARKAREACPNLSNGEILSATSDPNNIQPGETYSFVDKLGY